MATQLKTIESKLVECPACHSRMSKAAFSCPQCGDRSVYNDEAGKYAWTVFGLILLVAATLTFTMWLFRP